MARPQTEEQLFNLLDNIQARTDIDQQVKTRYKQAFVDDFKERQRQATLEGGTQVGTVEEEDTGILQRAGEAFVEQRQKGIKAGEEISEATMRGEITPASAVLQQFGAAKEAFISPAIAAVGTITEPITERIVKGFGKLTDVTVGEEQKEAVRQLFGNIAQRGAEEFQKLSPETQGNLQALAQIGELPLELAELVGIGAGARIAREAVEPAIARIGQFGEEILEDQAVKASISANKEIDALGQQIFQPSPAIAARDPRLLESIADTARIIEKAESFEDLSKQLTNKRKSISSEIGTIIEKNADKTVNKTDILSPIQERLEDLKSDAQTRKQANKVQQILDNELENLEKIEGETLSLAEAQARKVKLNELLSNFFKKTEDQMTDLELAELQALNEIRRGYMRVIGESVPEIKPLNETFGSLSVTIPMAERLKIRSGNVLKPRGVSAFVQSIPGVNLLRRIAQGQVPVDEALFSRAASLEEELGGITKRLEKLSEKDKKRKKPEEESFNQGEIPQTRITPSDFNKKAEAAGFTELKNVDVAKIKQTRSKPNEEVVKRNIKKLEQGEKLDPVIISNDGSIVDGNHRFEAMKRFGIKNIPVRSKPTLDNDQ